MERSGSAHAEGTIDWSAGEDKAGSSTFEADNVVTRTLGQTVVVSLGKVTEGQFAGSGIRKVIVFVNPRPSTA